MLYAKRVNCWKAKGEIPCQSAAKLGKYIKVPRRFND